MGINNMIKLKDILEGFTSKTLSPEDVEVALDEFITAKLKDGKDYISHTARGDDTPHAFTPKNSRAKKILDMFDEEDY
tara:strand:+ start:207 stop:440 length:234 start_codon:yes stop_codon:yes gene_type:complete